MKTKLSKKEIALSVMMFVIGTIMLGGIMFLIIWIGFGEDVMSFVVERFSNVTTVVVSVATLSMIMYAYFYFENQSVLARCSKIFEIYLLICLSFTICFFVGKYVEGTARPLLFMPFMAAMLLRRKDAIFVTTVYALILFIFNRYLNSSGDTGVLETGGIAQIESFSSLLTVFCGGVLGIILMQKIKTRLGSVMVAIVLLLAVVPINVIMRIPTQKNLTIISVLELSGWAAMDCIFSCLLFMFFLPVFETMFSELTPFRLRELTSDNTQLIARLKKNALGTYNHSVVVAQLAEACASAIGEDAELARAAAYYHDVGKLKNPEMFAENQTEYNLHTELTPELSVDIIRSHTRDGAKLIKKNRLPEIFADVAIEHHGTLPIKYFYAKALKMSDGELNMANYSYAGPTPSSKIAAIIMIADASEAATRSLADRSPEKVESVVSNIVAERMNLDQFANCNVTMRDLTVITSTIVSQLTGVYHSRVKYPKLKLIKQKDQNA